MEKRKLVIENCMKCPFHTKEQGYGEDSWDVFDVIKCKKLGSQIGTLDWHEKEVIPVPKRCPLPKK